MDSIKQIDVHSVKEIEGNDFATIIDIRDPASYQAGHIPNAIHLSDNTVEQFINDTDKDKPKVISETVPKFIQDHKGTWIKNPEWSDN